LYENVTIFLRHIHFLLPIIQWTFMHLVFFADKEFINKLIKEFIICEAIMDLLFLSDTTMLKCNF